MARACCLPSHSSRPHSLIAEAVMVMATAGIECRRVAQRGCVEVAAKDGGAIAGPTDLREGGRKMEGPSRDHPI